MKRYLAMFLFLVAGFASAADLTVTVPASAVPKAVEMCELLRQEIRVRAGEWSNDLCATLFLRVGLRVYVDRFGRQGAQQTIDDAVQAEIDTYDTNWPVPYTAAYCGDGVTDIEFGEECDDGNTVPGDGCDEGCRNET